MDVTLSQCEGLGGAYAFQCIAYRAVVADIFLLLRKDWSFWELYNDICETEKYLPAGILWAVCFDQ